MPPTPPLASLLIVDDEAAQMKALCDTLEDHGYITTGFSSSRQALEAVKSGEMEFDLLLTDLMMPEMDGITLLREALQVDPNLVGIMMTGHGAIDTAVEAMKAGAMDYILKPFKLSIVKPVLTRALTMRQLRLDNRVLERRVTERTAELEAANKELEAFSYSVSHDLRAPLRAIDGFSKMCLEDYGSQVPGEAQTLLRNICSSAGRMQQLINDLLEFSRLGRLPIHKQPVQVQPLVQQIIDDLRKENDGREVELKTDKLPDCVGDPSLLKQVWINLLSNAFKFTRDRKPAVIEVGTREEKGERVYFVRDNGAGFDMKYAAKLFGVFQRLHSVKDFAGTGVGLSIVQRIIHRHGGRIWAEAEPDKGAAFYFTIPAPTLLDV